MFTEVIVTAAEITSLPMTVKDEVRLTELEKVVEAGVAVFVAVGAALTEIRDLKLYRQTHSAFAGYLADRWGISEPRGYQLMNASRISTTVESAGLPPIGNEAQARELATLSEPDILTAWKAANETTAGRPTAGAVRDAAAPIRPTAAPAAHRPRRKPLPDEYRSVLLAAHGLTTKLNGLHRDDRFTANRAVIARSWLSAIDRLITEFTALRTDLAGELGPTLPGFQDEHPVPVENVVPTADAVVEIRGNSAVVLVGRGRVAEEVKALGITTMPDVKTRKLSFPADRIDDVAAAIEARGWTIDVRMAASW